MSFPPACGSSAGAVSFTGKPGAKLRVLIVDDEPLARQRIDTLLRTEETVELIGECADGVEAVTVIKRERPDIVFLDLQMPGCDGLEVATALPAGQRPAFIFVTAHARFAVEAFAVHAIDYVLKPFDRERLLMALQRASAHLHARRAIDLATRVENLLAGAPAAHSPGRLVFKTEGRVYFFKPDEILRVEADNNHAILHLADRRRLVLRETLGALEAQLGPMNFARINRSAIVRLDQVRELLSTPGGDQTVVLLDGTKLPLSRGLRGQLEKLGADGA
jgi:two-component system, LytTR family, response regulator